MSPQQVSVEDGFTNKDPKFVAIKDSFDISLSLWGQQIVIIGISVKIFWFEAESLIWYFWNQS